MCGRTACALAPDDICRACGYKNKQGSWRQPRWQDPPGGQKYYTSYNVAPTTHTPVLLSKSHFDSPKQTETEETTTTTESETSPESDCEWVVQPMQWGLVPFWNQGDAKSVGYSMINARSESMMTKQTFKVPLEKGRRCVVLVDGYYEWQTGPDGKKQPYFLYFPHAASETVEELNKTTETAEQNRVFTGKRLLTLAGLFDIWRPKNGDPPLYSYSIITVDAHKQLSWLHDRMPAVLDGEEDVRAWLDHQTVSLKTAVDLIRPRETLHHHPVSSYVGNVKNKGEECVKPLDLEKEKAKQAGGSSSVMMSWLNKGKKRSSDDMSQSEGTNQGASQSEASTVQTSQSDASTVQTSQSAEGSPTVEEEDKTITSPEKKEKSTDC